jgi:hypothetical protein
MKHNYPRNMKLYDTDLLTRAKNAIANDVTSLYSGSRPDVSPKNVTMGMVYDHYEHPSSDVLSVGMKMCDAPNMGPKTAGDTVHRIYAVCR